MGQSPHPLDQRLVWLVVAGGALVVILAVAAAVLLRALLPPSGTANPILPAPVASVLSGWDHAIVLPTSLPPCLDYSSGGAEVIPDADAGGERALKVRFSTAGPNCAAFASSDLVLLEAPTLQSLQGRTTTVSYGHLQYAILSEPAPGGRSRLTLQWHCADIMCRLSALSGGAFDETTLVRLAGSFAVARP